MKLFSFFFPSMLSCHVWYLSRGHRCPLTSPLNVSTSSQSPPSVKSPVVAVTRIPKKVVGLIRLGRRLQKKWYLVCQSCSSCRDLGEKQDKEIQRRWLESVFCLYLFSIIIGWISCSIKTNAKQGNIRGSWPFLSTDTHSCELTCCLPGLF